MDRQSIRGYARATRALYDALPTERVPEHLFDRIQRNPLKGLAELMHLVRTNDLMTDDLEAIVGDSLWDVDSDQPGELDIEDQGTFILDWFKAEGRQVDTITVPEAATEAGVTLHAIRAAIETNPEKLVPGRILGSKPHGRWILDRQSFEDYKTWRATRRDHTS